MSIPDSLIEKYVRLVSGLEKGEAAGLLALKPRDAKAALARRLASRLHGDEAAGRAEEDFNVRFRKRDVPENIPELAVSRPDDLLETLVEAGLAKSRGDARRLVEQGGVRVNNEKVGLDAKVKDGEVLSAGKRNFVRIRLR
jgi:tyrosyl-tRNA synthetase